MKILAEPLTASEQITINPCYLVGVSAGYENRSLKLNNEGDSSATAGKLVMTVAADPAMLPLPGLECPDGLYAAIDHGDGVVYYYY